jgi:ring-1,2-phenylacetyl-CoA epoxidase subunit PaaE
MSVQFHTLTIDQVVHDTADTVAISLSVPEAIAPLFQYKAGQYLTLKIDIDGVSHRRNYSLCSSPALDEPLTIAVKKVSTGVVSAWLNDHVQPGQELEVYPPMGNFTKELRPDHARHYVMIAGGSGITPILSIIKSVLRIQPQSIVTLIYANRNESSIIFDGALQELAGAYTNRLRLVHVLEEPATSGRAFVHGQLSSSVFSELIPVWVPSFDVVDTFVCGPEPMMDLAIAELRARGLADERIHREYFTLSTSSMNTEQSSASSNELVSRRVRIRLYGQEHEFDVEPDETILSAAQRANLDPPYACQIGACCTCRAKLVQGTAIMDEREALSDDEIADGYVLTCQAHPTSDGVFADYDQ